MWYSCRKYSNARICTNSVECIFIESYNALQCMMSKDIVFGVLLFLALSSRTEV